MAVEVTLSSILPSTVPDEGWIVSYRLKGSEDAYTVLPAQTAQPIVFTTDDAAGTLYEGTIKCDCGELESTIYFWTDTCACVETGFSPEAGGAFCQKVETIPATVTASGYCLAFSVNGVYSQYESRIYTLAFLTASNTDKVNAMALAPGSTGGLIQTSLTTGPQWANPTGLLDAGPLNREGVWLDTDCDGFKDSAGFLGTTTFATSFNNTGGARTIYIGVGADNQFQVVVNGVQVADSDFSVTGTTGAPFKIWHIIPVNIVAGTNLVNVIGTGDGGSINSVGLVVYDNTLAELVAAGSDADLNILFHTGSLRTSSYDVASCPSGYSLDVSGGVGSYVCVKVESMACNTPA